MKKWNLAILIMLTVPIVTALQECQGVMTSSDVPCLIISSWQYANSCSNYTVKLYNGTPTLIQNLTMGDYGLTGRCNITFNQSTEGTYLFNYSSGDSASIIVEVDEKMYIALSIGITGLALFFLIAGIFLYVKFKDSDQVHHES